MQGEHGGDSQNITPAIDRAKFQSKVLAPL